MTADPSTASSTQDKLAEIERHITTHRLYVEVGEWSPDAAPWNITYRDVTWLIDEVKRLRGLSHDR